MRVHFERGQENQDVCVCKTNTQHHTKYTFQRSLYICERFTFIGFVRISANEHAFV